MCRNIKTLFNFEPPATEQEIREASLQFVRKLSGFTAPSRANEAAFQRAVAEVAGLPTEETTQFASRRRSPEANAILNAASSRSAVEIPVDGYRKLHVSPSTAESKRANVYKSSLSAPPSRMRYPPATAMFGVTS